MILHSLSSEGVDFLIVDLLVDLPAASEVFLFSFDAPKALYLGEKAIISFV